MDDGARPAVLIVDDDPTTVSILRGALDDMFDVVTAGTAEESVELATNGTFAAVITDLHLPARDGLWLLAIVKLQSPRTRRILISADSHGLVRAPGRANAFYAKPVPLGRLKTDLAGAASRFRSRPH